MLALPLALLLAALVATPAAAASPKPSATCDFLDASVCLFPFPNDYFRKKGRVAFAPSAMPGDKAGKKIDPAEWNRNDGFSPGQTILTHVGGLDNARAFAKTNPVQLSDLSRYTARNAPIVVINARTRKRHLIWAELDPHPKKRADVNLQIRPGKNWEEGQRYIVALRNLKDASGRTIQAGGGFRLYRDGIEHKNRLVESRRAHFESIFKTLAKAGIKREGLYLAWDFTVASEKNLTERVLHIRNDAFKQLGDTNLADGVVQGSSPGFTVTKTDVVADQPGTSLRITGTYQVPCYLDQPNCVPGSGFRFANAASNLPQRTAGNFRTAPFYCNVPSAASPSNKAIAVQYGHGLLGSGDQVFNEQDIQDMAAEHNSMYCATDWTAMAREGDPPVGVLEAIKVLNNLSRFPNFADRLQQGLVDQMYLGRLLLHPQGLASHPSFQQGGQPIFDGSTLYYDSNSQGGIMGGALVPLSPDFTNAVLGVPAINYSILLRRSVDFDNYATIMYRQYPNERERPLVLGLLQMLWDRGEGNGYAHHIVGDPLAGSPDHRVLMHVALGDHQVTTIAADIEARTIGARVRRPAIDAGRSNERKPLFGIPSIGGFPFTGRATLVYWDTGPVRSSEGTNPAPLTEVPNRAGRDPHSGPRRSAQSRAQKLQFLTTGQVVDTCGSKPCYAYGWTGP